MLKFALYLLCCVVSITAHAELYRIIDEDGHITYTDMAPSMDAKGYKIGGSINTVDNPAFNITELNMRIPYTEKNGVMVTSGFVNGVAMNFIIDTGASLIAIPPSIAKQAKLLSQTSQDVTVQTANGTVNVPKVSINKIKIAAITQSNVEATIQSISTTDPNLGLLGMVFFNKYKVTIDDQEKEIVLGAK